MSAAPRSDRTRAVATYYDRLAPVYGDGEFFRLRRAAVLMAIAAELDGARAVLDLGCGNGAYLGAFAARAARARVTGAELSPDMLAAARRRLGERVALVRADATALPFGSGSFDLVFMSHVLMLVGDIETCVAEIACTLAPGGRLVATVGTGHWRELVRQWLGLQEARALESLFASSGRVRAAADDAARGAAACAQVGLQPEWRRAPFTVTWPAVEEWVRIRWLTIADDAGRALAEQWLAEVRPRTAGRTLELAETLLVARKS
jgi:ubiquinone/menaquinone biosynthesis C-methylase UbiE